MGDRREVARPQVGLVAAEHLAEGAVDLEEPAVGGDEGHADGRRLERGAEAALALAEHGLGPAALADLPRHGLVEAEHDDERPAEQGEQHGRRGAGVADRLAPPGGEPVALGPLDGLGQRQDLHLEPLAHARAHHRRRLVAAAGVVKLDRPPHLGELLGRRDADPPQRLALDVAAAVLPRQDVDLGEHALARGLVAVEVVGLARQQVAALAGLGGAEPADDLRDRREPDPPAVDLLIRLDQPADVEIDADADEGDSPGQEHEPGDHRGADTPAPAGLAGRGALRRGERPRPPRRGRDDPVGRLPARRSLAPARHRRPFRPAMGRRAGSAPQSATARS